MSKSKKRRNISGRQKQPVALTVTPAADGPARAALRDLLDQLKGVGIYIPGVDEGVVADYAGLSFARAERTINDDANAAGPSTMAVQANRPPSDSTPAPTPRVVVVMDGGLIQDVMCDSPVSILVVDYDVEGADEDQVVEILQTLYEDYAEATLSMWEPSAELEFVQHRFNEYAEHRSGVTQAD